MGPARKDVLDKNAWAWVENTEPTGVTQEHVLTAYRVGLQECLPGSCRRNCRGSPRCLSGLGEQRWLAESSEDNNSSYADDPNIDKRDAGSFIGLKNLGATCYVNSLLQLWFHNLQFRKAIYAWDPMEDPEERVVIETDSKFPGTVVGHLQVLFANLQFSIRRFIDPSDFVHSLSLDTNQQQDAQEFSKLFISMLEDRLIAQSKPLVRDMISKNFRGEYSYVTKCFKCQRESMRPSTFYELDLNIQGHRTIGDSLAEFLHEEKLEGANKYLCAVCGDKQDATRCIRLKCLPPVLHLQLLRFVYDRTKGHKKKLNSVIQFPETLDMSEYLGLPPGSKVYYVSAVLLHMGSSAYSGHYIAHIKDSATGNWHKYNDESVENLEGKKLTLNSEEDGSESIPPTKMKGRTQRCAKGFVSSKNAYMLVYTLAGKNSQSSAHPIVSNTPSTSKTNGIERHGVSSSSLEAEMIAWGLEKRLIDKVNEQNHKFEEWTTQECDKRETYKVQTQMFRKQMIELCMKLCVPKEEDTFEFISTDWLSKCLHEGMGPDSKAPSIDNSEELCLHDRVDPSRVTNLKMISVDAANMLYERFSGGPRLMYPDDLCAECVRSKCHELRVRNKITADGKEITNLLKYRMDETDPGYWVGKNTLKSWKTIVLRRLRPPSNGKDSADNDKASTSSQKECNNEDEEMEESDEKLKTVNSRKRGKVFSGRTAPKKRIHLPDSSQENEITSSNGFDSGERKMVSESEDSKMDVCSSTTKDEGQEMKEDGNSSPSDENRDDRKEDEYTDDASQMLGFNDDAICVHGNLNVDESSRRLVPPSIWVVFQSYFPTAKEFPRNSQVCPACQEKVHEGQAVKDTHRKVAAQQKERLSDLYLNKGRPNLDPAARKTKAVNGALCPVEGQEDFFIVAQDFVDRWKSFIGRRCEPPLGLLNEPLLCQHQRLLYDPADPDDCSRRLVLVWPQEWTALQEFYSVDCELAGSRDLLTGDLTFKPAVCKECLESRHEAQKVERCTYSRARIFVRRVVDDRPDSAQGAAPIEYADPEFQITTASALPAASGDCIRRSARSRKPRGDKELVVSSDQTLFELKSQIYAHFHVAPFEQNLSLDGRSLEKVPSDITLGALNVYPRSIVLLRAAESQEDTSILDEKSSAPEEGFKGTGLLSGKFTR